MSESLVIQLGDGLAPRWLVCSAEGNVTVDAVSGELVQAAAMAAGRRVIVIVPSSDVLTTDSDVPAKGAAKLAQVVPYALEERVADEIENLHFAIGDRAAGTGRLPVLVVSRIRIDGWLAEMRGAGLQPQAIYSAASLVPSMPGQMVALLDGDTVAICTADSPPLVLPALAIADAFAMALANQASAVPGLEPAPLGLLLYAGHDEWQAHQQTIDALRDRFTGVKVQLLPSGPLEVLAPAAVSGEAVNLLQGALAVASPLEAGWRAWRIAAVLAASLLVVHLGVRLFELSRLHKTEASLDDSITTAFRSAMPGQQNATNARRRVAQRLTEVQSGGGSGTLLPALSAIATARNVVPNATIEGLTFRSGTVDLRINAPDAASLDAIGQQLRSSQWQADITGGTATGDSYRGRLQIKKAGA
jgi:general secretion pathway protein L